jgi:hypothetical protein
MAFNLDNYEDVQSRVRRFQAAFPVGRIVTDVIQFNAEKGHVLIAAQVYREHEDTLPAAVDYAFGDASTFPTNMRKFYVEDTCTSAIGRALSLILEGDKKPTKQDMERVKNDAILEKITVAPADSWETFTATMPDTAQAPINDVIANLQATLGAEEIPQCVHGSRIKKQGTAKTGKPYLGYMCPASKGIQQCEPVWYTYISQTGTFRAPDQTE